MRIDVHCHGWSEQYLDHVESFQVIPPPMIGHIRQMGGLTTETDLTERFRRMDEAGVDRQVISSAGMVIYHEHENAAIDFARFANDDYADISRAYPDRLAALATLPIPHVDAALAELSRALDELQLAGVCLPTSVRGLSLADERFEPLWAELDRRAATVFFHPAGAGLHSTLLNDYGLPWLLGAPLEDTFIATHLIARAIPLRYPNVRIIIAHLGGALPMLVGRLDDQPSHGDSFTHSEPPSVIARRMLFDVVGHRHPAGLRCAVETFGADCMVLGTDFPWQVGDRFVGGVRYVEEAGLDDGVAEQILDRNLDALFADLVNSHG